MTTLPSRCRPVGHSACAIVCVLTCLLPLPVQAAAPWPVLGHPQAVHREPIDGAMRFHGRTVQLDRELVAAPPAAVHAFYRSRLGSPLAEAQAGGSTVLSQQRGRHFLTVSIRDAGNGGSEVLAALAPFGPTARAAARLPLRLPAGSRLLSVLESAQGSQRIHQLVIDSPHSPAATAGQFAAALATRGLQPLAGAIPGSAGRHHFGGRNGDAELRLSAHEGGTSVLLTVREPGQ